MTAWTKEALEEGVVHYTNGAESVTLVPAGENTFTVTSTDAEGMPNPTFELDALEVPTYLADRGIIAEPVAEPELTPEEEQALADTQEAIVDSLSAEGVALAPIEEGQDE